MKKIALEWQKKKKMAEGINKHCKEKKIWQTSIKTLTPVSDKERNAS